MLTKLMWIGAAALALGAWPKAVTAQEELNPEEIRRLVRQISRDMKSAEEIIIRTGAGARETQERVLENLEKLVQNGKKEQESVLEGIDRLIEAAKYQQQQQQQSQGSGQGQDQQGQSRPQSGSRRREGQRSDDLQRTGEDERQQQGQDQQGGHQEPQQGDQPRGAQAGNREGQQQQGGQPPQGELGEGQNPAGYGSWGNLPDKVQEQIRSFDPNQYPQKYRKWLNDYLRRLNDVDRR